MKKIFRSFGVWLAGLVFFAAALSGGASAADEVDITTANFPHKAFRTYVSSFDKDGSGTLSQGEIAAVTDINCSGMNITTLRGIEFFTSLKTLNCSDNSLSALNIKANTALTSLNCSFNSLTALNVSANTALTALDCSSNQIAALNLANNTALTYLEVSDNALTSLDVSRNTALTELNYRYNAVSPDLSQNKALTLLDCSSTQLTSLNIKANTALERLYCYDNQLTALDLSANKALKRVDCTHNAITALDVSGNTALTELWADSNRLTSLTTGSVGLTELHVNNNRLASLALSGNTKLTYLDCYANRLTALNLANNTRLNWLDCSENQLASLDLRLCPILADTAELGEVSEVGEQRYYSYSTPSGYGSLCVDASVSLKTCVKPTVTVQPKNVTAALEAKVSFKAQGDGGGVHYQWYCRTTPTGGWKVCAAASAKTDTYKVTATEARSGYEYRCRIYNSAGHVYTNTVKLTVVNFTITGQPSNRSIWAGSTATFKVTASGSSLRYQWYYMKPGSGTWTKVASNGTKATYKLTTAERHNNYRYRCKVSNYTGSVYTSAVTLTVKPKPVITAQSGGVTVSSGKTATFSVTAEGQSLRYQWYYKKPGDTAWTAVANNGTAATYKLTAKARHDGYRYRCKVTNGAGSVYSASVLLTVK